MSFITPAYPSTNSRSGSSFNNQSQQQQQNQVPPPLQETITTLHEAADAFDEITKRSQRCSLQIAKWKAHEQQVRKFLIERVVPHADDSIRDREGAMQRREEEYGTALLRLKGVQLPAGSSPRGHMMMTSNSSNNNRSSFSSPQHHNSVTRATDDNPELAASLENLKKLYSQYGKNRY